METLFITLKANTKVVQIISFETLRIHGFLVKTAAELGRKLFKWNSIEGLSKWNFDEKIFETVDENIKNSSDVLEDFLNTDSEHFKENVILLIENAHFVIDENERKNIERIRLIALKNTQNKTLVLSQPFRFLPRELEKEVETIEIPYPDINELRNIYWMVCQKFSKDCEEPDDALLEAALGLTIMETERAFSKALVEDDELTVAQIPMIIKEKEAIIKRSGFLEYYHPSDTLKDIGGLDNLKDWLRKRGRGFTKDARDFGLDTPRGILLLGIPGTGKSLTAKAIGAEWNFPLLRLDMGKVFGGIVGESESNIRRSLQIAEAISPSVLWIDEIEKGLSGVASSGATDAGTTARVLGTFLTWMQEKTKPVFVVATANDISQLPPELLRKGRFDEIFFVDLPTKKERKEILRIHISKKDRNPENFDLEKLAEASKGFSGAELEEAVKEGLFRAYDAGHDLTTDDILGAIKDTTPLSKTMAEIITGLRKWAERRAVLASSEKPEKMDSQDEQNVPKLKQETYLNPFID